MIDMEKNLNLTSKSLYLMMVVSGLVWLAFVCFSALSFIGALFLFALLAFLFLLLANNLLIAAAMLMALPISAIMTGLNKIISGRRATGA